MFTYKLTMGHRFLSPLSIAVVFSISFLPSYSVVAQETSNNPVPAIPDQHATSTSTRPASATSTSETGASSTTTKTENNCAESGSPMTFVDVKWNIGVCYFTIKGATLRANTKVDENHYTFNVSAARLICAAHNATLPMFDDNEEYEFVLKNYREQFDGQEITQLALGQYKSVWNGKEYKTWDDGAKIGHWKFKDIAIADPWSDSAYALLFAKTTYGLVLGHWYPSNKPWTQPLGVLCQRRESQPENTRRTNMCMTPPEYFPEIHLQSRTIGRLSEDLCFFFVTGSSLIANEKVYPPLELDAKYSYNVDKARRLCQQYRATLPTILSHEECEHLWEHSHFMRTIEQKRGSIATSREIVIGINQEVHKNGFEYKWETGDEVTYESEWYRKYTKAAYTKFTFGSFPRHIIPKSCIWENVPQNETATDSPLLTLCQQRLSAYKPPEPEKNKVSLCSTEPTREEIAKKATFRDACYFKLKADRWNASIVAARDACAEFGGVLPVIRDQEENDFIAKAFYIHGHYRPEQVAILGLRQMRRPDEYQWIDGSPLPFTPKEWDRREEYTYATVLMLGPMSWKNFESFTLTVLDEIWIICKDLTEVERSSPTPTSTRKPTTTTRRTTAEVIIEPPPPRTIPTMPPNGEPCDEENRAIYGRTEWLKTNQSHICYFVIPGATYAAAMSPRFSIEQARKLCADHSASLPILFTIDEARYVAQKFKPDDFDKEILGHIPWGSNMVAGIAIDLKMAEPLVNGKRHLTYTWTGDIPLNYEPTEWRNRRPHRINYGEMMPLVYVYMSVQKSFGKRIRDT